MRLLFILLAVVSWISSSHAAEGKPLRVITTFSILADFAKQVGGDRVEVVSLVAPAQDAHMFEPTPDDVKRVSSANIVIINGLGFEGWLARLVESSGYKGTIIEASKQVATITSEEEHSHHEHDHSAQDPHAWQDVARARKYVKNIRDALMARDPSHAATYYEQAKSYLEKLNALEREIRAKWEAVPLEKRKVITSHDAFGYYAHAYGVTFLAPLGLSSESEASAKDIAMLIGQIRSEKVTAIFVENINNSRLMEQIRQDTGLALGGTLYSDALSDSSGPASTYIDMMRHNTDAMIRAVTLQAN
jgi:zinc/manganese transport system substrate-binding protein